MLNPHCLLCLVPHIFLHIFLTFLHFFLANLRFFCGIYALFCWIYALFVNFCCDRRLRASSENLKSLPADFFPHLVWAKFWVPLLHWTGHNWIGDFPFESERSLEFSLISLFKYPLNRNKIDRERRGSSWLSHSRSSQHNNSLCREPLLWRSWHPSSR